MSVVHARAQDCSYDSIRPRALRHGEVIAACTLLGPFGLPAWRAAANHLFAAAFDVAGNSHFVFVGDNPSAMSIVKFEGARVVLGFPVGGPLPDLCAKLVSPRQIADAEWDLLARCRCFATRFERGEKDRGRSLARSHHGVRFNRRGAPMFVLTSSDGTCVEVLEIRADRPRRLSSFALKVHAGETGAPPPSTPAPVVESVH